MPELCFVTASRANAFMVEILEAVAAAVAELGVPVSFAVDDFPPGSADRAYVVIPHELFPFLPPERQPEPELLHRTVSFCVEHPGTIWFDISCDWARTTAAVVDINRSSTTEMRRRGIPAEHVQLGYSRLWDRWSGKTDAPRPVDVAYLASTDMRRDALLAGFATTLHSHRCRFAIAPLEPKTGAMRGYYLGRDKHDLLASTKVILNLHRGESRSLEWVRVLEAISNGCVVVSEHSLDASPLVPGRHFVSAQAEHLAEVADHLLRRDELLTSIAAEAYEFLRAELAMRGLAERLTAMAESIVRAAPPVSGSSRAGRGPLPPEGLTPAAPPNLEAGVDVRVGIRHLATQLIGLRRELGDLRSRIAGQTDDLAEVVRTPAYDRTTPRVTVGISLFEYEREVPHALASVIATRYSDYEVVIVDDASRDGSVDAARRVLEEHPWVPGVIHRRRVNGGPAAARNTILQLARGELVLVLDADNGLYPTCMERLVEALDADAEASFAYPMLAVRLAGKPTFVWNRLPWDPSRLAAESYIDALALIRRSDLLHVGGYREDVRLEGVEDYDLWCRLADAGRRGVQVPEILAWYRLKMYSKLSEALVDQSAALSIVREGSPRLFAADAR